MPIAKVQAPDGRTFKIEVPNGASEADILSFAQSQWKPQDEASFGGNLLSGLDLSYQKTMEGLAQAGLGVGAAGASALGFPETSEALSGGKKFLETKMEGLAPEREKLESTAGGAIGKFAGDISQISTLGAPLKIAGAAPLLADVIGAGAFGASQAANSAGDRLMRGATDAALTYGGGRLLGGQRITKGAQAAVEARAAEKAADIARATKAGIPVGITQATDSPLVKMLGTTAETLSFTSPARRAQEAFNRSISRSFGQEADKITPEVLESAKASLGKVFDEASSYGLPNASRAMADIDDIVSSSWGNLPQSVQPQVFELVKDIKSLVQPDGSITGTGLQNISRHLRNTAFKEKGSLVGETAKKISDVIEDNLMGTLPKGLDESLMNAREQYKALLAVAPLAERGAGSVSPAAMLNRVSSQYSSIPAAGQLGDAALAGKQFLTQKIPDSTTAQRNLMLSVLAGGGAATGGLGVLPSLGIAGGATAAAEAMSSPAVRAMVDLLKRGGQKSSPQYIAPAMANYLRGEQ